jgi:hypothetical protein
MTTLFFNVVVNASATACNAVQRPYEKQNTIIPFIVAMPQTHFVLRPELNLNSGCHNVRRIVH